VNDLALIEKVADRMLNLVAPKLTAGACCLSSGKHVTEYCYGGYCTDRVSVLNRGTAGGAPAPRLA
jgi:hypothetical protein